MNILSVLRLFTRTLVVTLLFAGGPSYSQIPGIEPKRPIALKGTIVTPSRVIQKGWVLIEGYKISGIHNGGTRVKFPDNTIIVDTKGIIFPGMVDVHNHVAWNIFQPWSPDQEFNNRYEWRFDLPEYQVTVAVPREALRNMNMNWEMQTYGEIRALIGGTTSVVIGENVCINGLTRQLKDRDQVSERRIEDSIDIFSNPEDFNKFNIDEFEIVIDNQGGVHTIPSNPLISQDFSTMKTDLESGDVDAFFIHLAEGREDDRITEQEFSILQAKGLLTDKTSIIHGISLGLLEFEAMSDAGTSLVWSPRSNITLYGETANILAAKSKEVRIALAPDWAITGSRNMFEELQYARYWNRRYLDKLFTDKDLYEMVTSIPAAMAGLGDKIGSIEVGLFADLLVVSGNRSRLFQSIFGNHSRPYRSLIRADFKDVKLVIVNGSPVYGRRDLMEKFWTGRGELEVLSNTNPDKVLKMPFDNCDIKSFGQLHDTLRAAMETQGILLTPLFPVKNSRNTPGNKKLDKSN